MNSPKMFPTQRVAPETYSLVSYYPLPGAGILPVNSFLIRGAQPVLVDTGVAVLRDDYMANLKSMMDLKDLRWIWLTHIDADHVGNLLAILKEAPEATVVTTFLGLGKLGLLQAPVQRFHLLNPGQRLNIGDRELLALTPPCFDAPETTGFMDTRTGVLFSSDCFGALMHEPAETARVLSAAALRDGMIGWSTVDSPWLHNVNPEAFRNVLSKYRSHSPSLVLSSHLPPAEGMLDTLCRHLQEAQNAPRFVGPDQAAFQQMMAASV